MRVVEGLRLDVFYGVALQHQLLQPLHVAEGFRLDGAHCRVEDMDLGQSAAGERSGRHRVDVALDHVDDGAHYLDAASQQSPSQRRNCGTHLIQRVVFYFQSADAVDDERAQIFGVDQRTAGDFEAPKFEQRHSCNLPRQVG